MARTMTALALAASLLAPAAFAADTAASLKAEVAAINAQSPEACAQLKAVLLKTLALLDSKPAARSSRSAAAPKAAPGTARPSVPLFGKRGLTKVHRADCRFGKNILEDTRIEFKSCDEAARQGYSPCRVCQPDQP
jgi:hypothetical protein